MLGTLLTFLVVGVVAMVVLGVVLAMVGVAVGLLFKILPLLLIGWLAVKLLAPKRKQLSAEDRKWLES